MIRRPPESPPFPDTPPFRYHWGQGRRAAASGRRLEMEGETVLLRLTEAGRRALGAASRPARPSYQASSDGPASIRSGGSQGGTRERVGGSAAKGAETSARCSNCLGAPLAEGP